MAEFYTNNKQMFSRKLEKLSYEEIEEIKEFSLKLLKNCTYKIINPTTLDCPFSINFNFIFLEMNKEQKQ